MDVGAFDYNSIMIYGSADGAKDGTYTMLKKDGSLIAGQRNGLSAGDIYTVRLLYGPPYVQVARENIVWYYYEGYAYSEDYNRLYFFSDKNPTSPVTRLAVSDHDRYVTVGYTCYNRSGSSISSFTSYRGYFIPAGTSVYSLGQTTYRSVEEYGNIVEHYDEQYFIPLGL